MVELFKVRRSSSFAKGLTCHWGPTPLGGNLALFLSGVIDVEHVSSLAVCKGVAVCARNANWAPFESTRLFVCKRNSCRRLEIKGQEKSETLSLQISDFLATPTSSGLCFEMEWVSSPYLSILFMFLRYDVLWIHGNKRKISFNQRANVLHPKMFQARELWKLADVKRRAAGSFAVSLDDKWSLKCRARCLLENKLSVWGLKRLN